MRNQNVSNPHLANVYALSSVEEKRSAYKEWANTYDREVESDLGYVGPRKAVEAFRDRVPDLKVRLLDAGCGTGLVGRELHHVGYHDIHGVDFSPQMLAQARAVGVYSSLAEADLTRPLAVDEPFDAAISVGLFGFGPPHLEHLVNIVHAVVPDGMILITVNGRGWREKNWGRSLLLELDRRALELLEQFEIDYLLKENIKARMLVLRRA